VRLCVTRAGIARVEGDELVLPDLPHPDLASLLLDGLGLGMVGSSRVKERLPLAETLLLAPVAHPQNLVLHGFNYRGHAAEANVPIPSAPTFILAPGGPLDGPRGEIVLPADPGARVDYEGEIAVVMGDVASDVSAGEAWSRVAGLMVMNDVSERRAQFAAMSGSGWDEAAMAASKRHPTFKPTGPVLVTADEVEAEPDLALRTRLNGVVVQDDRTTEMIFSFSEIVAAVSRRVTLQPGDVVATGTPAGVGMATRRYLRAGDEVEVEVESVGTVSQRVVPHPDSDPSGRWLA
jgi:2-keto-4-pentenoate hydratase/2-oxohepta-3-ene-1,7-dioic acid hydratase in catechol pathway